MKTKRILVIADTHIGSRLGLTPPEWIPPDTAMVLKPMWDWYEKTIKDIGPVDVAVLNGDGLDGEGKREDIEQLTTDTMKQVEIAETVFEKIKTNRWYLTFGSPFHSVGSYNYEEPLADALNGSIKDTQLLHIEEWKFNFRHVVGNSTTPYGQGTQLFKEAVRDMMRATFEDREAADFTVRSHIHYFTRMESANKVAISTPCFQVPLNVFGRKCRPFYYDIGLLLFEVSKEKVDIQKFIMPLRIVVKREYEKVI